MWPSTYLISTEYKDIQIYHRSSILSCNLSCETTTTYSYYTCNICVLRTPRLGKFEKIILKLGTNVCINAKINIKSISHDFESFRNLIYFRDEHYNNYLYP